MNPAVVAVLIILVIGGLAVARFFVNFKTDPFRTAAALDLSTYLENANSLRSNIYKLQGEVVNSLAWSPSTGRLISVEVENGNYIIPVLVPKNFNEINIQKGQKFIFLLEVGDNGLLRTKSIIKA